MPLPQATLPPDARVLVIRLSALGDIVFALPAIQALRHHLPQARVDWLVEDRHAELVASHPAIDEVVVFPRRRWKNARGIRKVGAVGAIADHLLQIRDRGRYDLVIDLQGNLKSAMHLLFAQADHSVGFDKPLAREGSQRFVRQRVADPGRVHRCVRDLALVGAIGYEGPLPRPAAWPVDTQAEQDVDLRLAHELSVPELASPSGPVVLLHTEVTSYGRDKQWPADRWLELGARLCAERGARVLLLWDPSNRERVLRLVEQSGGSCGLAPPTPSLQHLMALTDRAALLIGTDSGPVHLASYRGTAVVALYGPTDPVVYQPPGPRTLVLSATPADQPPPPRDRSGPSPLMEKLTVEKVAQAAFDSLDA